MENADRPTLLRFSDFAGPGGPLDGKKIKIEEVLNIEILLLAFKMKEGKYQRTSSKDCLTIQFEYPDRPGERHVLFTGSGVLIDHLTEHGERLPFLATIKKIDRYFTLS